MSSLVKVHQLFKIWCELNLDIVCVQETKLAADNTSRQREVQQALDAAAARHGHPGFEVQWGCNTASSAGVVLLFRKDLPLEMVGGVHIDNGGRLIHVRCKWAGHDLHLFVLTFPRAILVASRTSLLMS
jgi:exonuclease III